MNRPEFIKAVCLAAVLLTLTGCVAAAGEKTVAAKLPVKTEELAGATILNRTKATTLST